MASCRLIVDPPAAGAWNMALDEALLHSAAAADRPTLRFYQWNPATLSLGYFQRHEDRQQHSASRACPLVRRVTGGGAILHDRELTYSFTLGIDDRWARESERLYRLFHESLADALAEGWQIESRLHGGGGASCGESPADDGSFLCFQRRSCFDLIVNSGKVAGSAQRRHKQVLLQHGSVLLAASPAAPELPGLAELAGHQIQPEQLIPLWSRRIQSLLGVSFSQETVSPEETTAAQRWQATKFASDAWNRRR